MQKNLNNEANVGLENGRLESLGEQRLDGDEAEKLVKGQASLNERLLNERKEVVPSRRARQQFYCGK
jgi:hypothetical protein